MPMESRLPYALVRNHWPSVARRPVGVAQARVAAGGIRARAATVLLAGAALMTVASAVQAQIGAPIGAPTGMPKGLPAGSSGGAAYPGAYGTANAYDPASTSQRAGSIAPPVSNWNATTLGRDPSGAFEQRSASRSPAVEPIVVAPAVPQRAPVAPAVEPRNARAAPQVPQSSTGARQTEPLVATKQIKEAAGDAIERMQSLVQQGTMHETGLGAPRSLTRAFDLYCEAARQGFPEALIRMAWMYADGVGVEKSRAAAYTLFSRAARFGSEPAHHLAQRFAGEAEVLPVCLKGSVVERGTVERPATQEELSAFAPKIDATMTSQNGPLSAERRKYAQIVIAESRRYKLDPRLVLAVMATESGFDPNARSPKNAHGLMQLLPETAERFNVRNIDDPVENIRGGMAYLRWLLSYFRGDVALVLAAYNAGEGAVDKHAGVPPFGETLAYVQRIRAYYPFDRHPYDATAATAASKTAPAAAAVPVAPATVGAAPGTAVARN